MQINSTMHVHRHCVHPWPNKRQSMPVAESVYIYMDADARCSRRSTKNDDECSLLIHFPPVKAPTCLYYVTFHR